MNNLLRFSLILLFFIPLHFSGQEEAEDYKTFGIGIVPQYAISNGTRIDLDFRLNRKGHWLVLAPQFYLNVGNSDMWDFEEMVGAGIEVQHKLFFIDKPEPKGAYLAYGPVFQYFSVKEQGLAAYNFEEGGVEYIGLDEELIQTRITKFGGNLMVGMQTVISNFLYLDAYIGTGIRLSFDNRTSGLHGYYNDWWGDFGYSGTMIVAGIRFGVSL